MTKLDLAHLAEVAGKLNAALAAHDDVMESYISASTQADYLAALGERDDRADEALFEHLAALDRGDVADLLALLDRLREAEGALRPFAEKGQLLEQGDLVTSPAHLTVAVIVNKRDLRAAASYFTPHPPALPGRGEGE